MQEIFENQDATNTSPELECDIIMKGGVTSGIVYPSAICEIAKEFRFCNIGGTSAGAIVSALTAAAEFFRANNPNGSIDKTRGFEGLKNVPDELSIVDNSGKTKLFNLFQPQQQTKTLYDLIIFVFGKPKKFAIFEYIIKTFKINISVGLFLPVLILVYSVISNFSMVSNFSVSGILHSSWYVLELLVLLFVTLVVSMTFFTIPLSLETLSKQLFKNVPKNFFGLCSGYNQETDPKTDKPSLTFWLNKMINQLADKNDSPLTFDDLAKRNIKLKLMTTCLTLGKPYSLPFEETANNFYFNKEEFLKLFPKTVVDFMIDDNAKTEIYYDEINDTRLICHPLPESKKLPVVVATRMSLSFPLLLSAVPLYAMDKSRIEKNVKLERCWFTDGGVTSNFPISLFDCPLPVRPTFGINLRKVHPDFPIDNEESNNIWMPRSLENKDHKPWNFIDGNIISFFWSIIDSMQNWVDSTQSVVPGYRERIVHISLDDQEGGLNLDMPKDLIDKLIKRGNCAGSELRKHYQNPPELGQGEETTWEHHRFVRFRSTMASLEDYLKKINDGYNYQKTNGATPYCKLIQNPQIDRYKWMQNQQDFAINTTNALMEMINNHFNHKTINEKEVISVTLLQQQNDPSSSSNDSVNILSIPVQNVNHLSFKPNAPEPQPELQIKPKI